VNFDEFKQFYKKHPGKSNSFYYRQFPKGNQSTIRNYKYRCKNAKNTVATHDATNNKITKSNPKQPPQVEGLATPPTDFIDDPNELLMSCATRELNKANPNVRWANILLTLLDKTKQLEAKSKQEVMIRRKLVKYSSNQLIELRKRLIKS